jgi:hypothetical protein
MLKVSYDAETVFGTEVLLQLTSEHHQELRSKAAKDTTRELRTTSLCGAPIHQKRH